MDEILTIISVAGVISIIVSIALGVLLVMTMIAIIGIRKELRIKNLYTKRTLVSYPYDIHLSDMELDVYDFLYRKTPEWCSEEKIRHAVNARGNEEQECYDALDALVAKGLLYELDGSYAVRLKNEP